MQASISTEALVQMIRRCRFDLSCEKRLQAEMEQLLTARGIAFEREKRLCEADIPDFLVDGQIVVECKMRGKARKIEVYTQLCRYAAHADVRAIVLATNMSMGLPDAINGKPVYLASLSSGWL